MKTLNLDLQEKSYPIYIGQDLLSHSELLTKHIAGKQVMIVSNMTVAPLYLDAVKALLTDYQVAEAILPDCVILCGVLLYHFKIIYEMTDV